MLKERFLASIHIRLKIYIYTDVIIQIKIDQRFLPCQYQLPGAPIKILSPF